MRHPHQPTSTLPPAANPSDETPFRPPSGAFLDLDSDDIDALIASGAIRLPPPEVLRPRHGAPLGASAGAVANADRASPDLAA